jgi:hypothetical protein
LGRKAAENLEKIVSTKLSAEDYQFLQKYAKGAYDAEAIELPTVSHALRLLVKERRTASLRKQQSQPPVGQNVNQDKLRPYNEQIERLGKLPPSPSRQNRLAPQNSSEKSQFTG